MTALTDAELARFRADGFLVLENFVDPARCDRLRARAEALVAGFEPPEQRSIFTTDEQARHTDDYFLDSGDQIRFFFEEDGRTINKIGHALHDLDPEFAAFSRTPALEALIGALGLIDPRLMQSMYIFKHAHVGGEVRCHQDSTFLHTEPEAMVGLWFALEEARSDNGCLWAIPGGQRDGLKARFVREGRSTRMDTLDATPWDTAAAVPLEVSKGAVILLDGLCPHMSQANTSPTSRHAYTLHVTSGASLYPPTNWLQRSTPARGFH